MSERILPRTGEALVEGAEDYMAAEPEVVIGEITLQMQAITDCHKERASDF
jgi:hypothetical protein